jgi:bifunctional DNA-binding transcriptional regulator/antitoxin component of YhaV-PrlF toxin-antitoxin module
MTKKSERDVKKERSDQKRNDDTEWRNIKRLSKGQSIRVVGEQMGYKSDYLFMKRVIELSAKFSQPVPTFQIGKAKEYDFYEEVASRKYGHKVNFPQPIFEHLHCKEGDKIHFKLVKGQKRVIISKYEEEKGKRLEVEEERTEELKKMYAEKGMDWDESEMDNYEDDIKSKSKKRK